MPQDTRRRYEVIEWLMFQMASVGPMLGQAHHFRRYAPEQIQYAIDRYTNKAARLYGVIDKRLSTVPYLAGEYFADMALIPGCAPIIGRARTWRISRISSGGMTQWKRGRPCNAVWP
jgi:GST-like protein